MIGVTAAASAGIYFSRGDIPPLIAALVALGVLAGAFIGSRLLTRLSNKTLRLIFLPVLTIMAIQKVMRGLGLSCNGNGGSISQRARTSSGASNANSEARLTGRPQGCAPTMDEPGKALRGIVGTHPCGRPFEMPIH